MQTTALTDAAAPARTVAPAGDAARMPTVASSATRGSDVASRRGRGATTDPRVGVGGRPGTRDLESIIGGQWLTWIGVIAIFFGTAFFVAIDLHESPIAGLGQIAIGTAVAALFLAIGSMLARRDERILGQGLLGGGVALLFLAAFAVTNFHHLAPARAIYLFLTAISVGGAMLAIRLASPSIAGLTLIGALLTPFFLELEGRDALQILPYLFVVNLGAVLVSTRKDWRGLPLASFLGSAILVALASAEVLEAGSLRMDLLAGVTALWLLFAVLPWISRSGPRFWSVLRASVVLLNASGFAFFLYHWLAPGYTQFRGLVTMLLGLAYLSAGILGERPRNEPLARAMQYSGIALFCVAIPIQLDLGSVTLVWAILGVILIELGTRRADPGYRALGALTLGADLIHALFASLLDQGGPDGYRPIANASFVGNVALVAAFGYLSWRLRSALDRPRERALSTPALLVGGLLLWIVISIETLHGFDPAPGETSTASMRLAANLTLSLVWAVYGALLIGAGFLFRFRPIRMLGFLVIGLLVFKVFALDIQGLERGYRIASFVLVGMLLLLVSVLYQRGRQRTPD
jgi:uncharacterized membrane protein